MKGTGDIRSIFLWRDSSTGIYYLRVKYRDGKEKKFSLGTREKIEAEIYLSRIKQRVKEIE